MCYEGECGTIMFMPGPGIGSRIGHCVYGHKSRIGNYTTQMCIHKHTGCDKQPGPKCNPAVLKVNVQIKMQLPPPRIRAEIGHESSMPLGRVQVWTLSRTPRGKGDKNNLESELKYSWV